MHDHELDELEALWHLDRPDDYDGPLGPTFGEILKFVLGAIAWLVGFVLLLSITSGSITNLL